MTISLFCTSYWDIEQNIFSQFFFLYFSLWIYLFFRHLGSNSWNYWLQRWQKSCNQESWGNNTLRLKQKISKEHSFFWITICFPWIFEIVMSFPPYVYLYPGTSCEYNSTKFAVLEEKTSFVKSSKLLGNNLMHFSEKYKGRN